MNCLYIIYLIYFCFKKSIFVRCFNCVTVTLCNIKGRLCKNTWLLSFSPFPAEGAVNTIRLPSSTGKCF